MQNENEIHLKELDLWESQIAKRQGFDATRHIRMVPNFNEKDVDKYFRHFEE